jgi:hypothetical protein
METKRNLPGCTKQTKLGREELPDKPNKERPTLGNADA